MIQKTIYSLILERQKRGEKLFSILIDPDKFESDKTIKLAEKAGVDFIMVGGSLITNGSFEDSVATIKKLTSIPVIIFPGNGMQITSKADAILLLSLISGRNANLLIGDHVIAAPHLKSSGLEIMPTGYMLIESGKQTAASYMSNTLPIPADKSDIAMCTAMAGEMLGLKLIYLDAGSGAEKCISTEMIKRVKESIRIPLIIGGGINSVKKAEDACKAGADMIVVGNAIEKDATLINNISKTIHNF